jgi:antitoxin component of MazEF toxin-antitoxin module
MARRRLNKNNVRNIQRSHGSYYITIPIDLIRDLKWQERQKVEVEKFGKDKIIIKDWPSKK